MEKADSAVPERVEVLHMEDKEFQQKSAELMALCKSRGATVDTEDLIDAHHLDCIWYDGYGIII